MAITSFTPPQVPFDCPELTKAFLDDQFRKLAPLVNGAVQSNDTVVGFYGTKPIAKQTGVAVTAAAIHAALVNLGLIGA